MASFLQLFSIHSFSYLFCSFLISYQCDEHRPSCVNCTTSERICSYPDVVRSSTTPSTSSSLSVPPVPQAVISDTAHGSMSSSAASPAPSQALNNSVHSLTPSVVGNSPFEEAVVQQPINQGDVNVIHLELLYHMLTKFFEAFGGGRGHPETLYDVIMPTAFATPYFMHELLAISALHMSTLRPNQRDFYEHQAVELQTVALSLYNQAQEDLTAENCLPMFLFSSFLGNNLLFTTFSRHHDDFNSLLDDFMCYLQVHRGVRVVTNHSWDLLRTTAHKFLFLDEDYDLPPIGESVGQECNGLRRLLESADLSPASISTCQEAVNQLQWTFDGQKSGKVTSGLVFAWPILISASFIDLLKQRRPEALAVLAHYAVLLHYNRDIWIFNNAGRCLIESITRHLGGYWEKWLAWPNTVLDMECAPTAQNSSTPAASSSRS